MRKSWIRNSISGLTGSIFGLEAKPAAPSEPVIQTVTQNEHNAAQELIKDEQKKNQYPLTTQQRARLLAGMTP